MQTSAALLTEMGKEKPYAHAAIINKTVELGTSKNEVLIKLATGLCHSIYP